MSGNCAIEKCDWIQNRVGMHIEQVFIAFLQRSRRGERNCSEDLAVIGVRNGDSKSTFPGSSTSLGNAFVPDRVSVLSASIQDFVCTPHKFLAEAVQGRSLEGTQAS